MISMSIGGVVVIVIIMLGFVCLSAYLFTGDDIFDYRRPRQDRLCTLGALLSLALMSCLGVYYFDVNVAQTAVENTVTESVADTSNVKEFIQVDNNIFEKVYIKDGEGNDTYILMPVEDYEG